MVGREKEWPFRFARWAGDSYTKRVVYGRCWSNSQCLLDMAGGGETISAFHDMSEFVRDGTRDISKGD